MELAEPECKQTAASVIKRPYMHTWQYKTITEIAKGGLERKNI